MTLMQAVKTDSQQDGTGQTEIKQFEQHIRRSIDQVLLVILGDRLMIRGCA